MESRSGRSSSDSVSTTTSHSSLPRINSGWKRARWKWASASAVSSSVVLMRIVSSMSYASRAELTLADLLLPDRLNYGTPESSANRLHRRPSVGRVTVRRLSALVSDGRGEFAHGGSEPLPAATSGELAGPQLEQRQQLHGRHERVRDQYAATE